MITLDGTLGITTPTYGGAVTAEYSVPVTGFKNRLINGQMMIDQRNAGGVINLSGSNQYPVDRFITSMDTAATVTAQQSSTAPTGFTNSLLISVTSGTAPSATNENRITQRIEGFNTADLGFGAAGASTVTLSFWVRCSLTGTFSGSLRNSAASRSYPFTYTINSANTWEQKSITVAGDTSGTWIGATNGTGLQVTIDLGSGSTMKGTANAWASANYLGVTGSTNLIANSGATFYITGVQLEKGSTATSFDYRPYGTELQLCQRYYETGGFVSFTTGGVNGIYQPIQFKCTKRVAAASCTSTNGRSLTMNIFNDATGVATGMYQGSNDSGASVSTWTVSAEL